MDSPRVSEDDLLRSLYEITVRVPNETLEAISRTPLWNDLALATQDQNWWFRRTEYLVGRTLTPRIGDWSRVYASLARVGLVFNGEQDYGSDLLVQVLVEIGAPLPKHPSVMGGSRSRQMLEALVKSASLEAFNLVMREPRMKHLLDPALAVASAEGKIEMVKALIALGADPSYEDNIPLAWAAGRSADVVKLLLSDPRVDPGDNPALLDISIYEGREDVARILLEDGRIDPSDDDNSAIRAASREGMTEIVKILLQDDRVDPSAEDNEALRNAANHGYIDIIELLLSDQRVDSSRGLKPAVASNRIDVVYLLLDRGAQIRGHVFPIACRCATIEIVKLLFPKVEDPSLNDNIALRSARTRRRRDVIELLLSDPRVRKLDEQR